MENHINLVGKKITEIITLNSCIYFSKSNTSYTINTNSKYIYPEDLNNLNFWAKKLGITIRQLKDAILYTGSLKTEDVKIYIKNNDSEFSFWSVMKSKLLN